MFNRIAPRATAFAFAVLATVVMLGGVDFLAGAPDTGSVFAASQPAPAQRVVVVADRGQRS